MRILFILIFSTFTCFIFSQSENSNISINENIKKRIAFSHLSIEDGLSQNSVISMTQDSIGYMWFATQDGLNRYDGNDFKIYNKQFEDITRPAFSNLGKVYIDKQNRLWIITNSGILERYNSQTDDFEKIKRFQNVSAIYQDDNFNKYIGTYKNGFYKIDHITKDTIQLFNKSERNKTVYDIYKSNDAVYITATNAIFRLKGNKYTNIVDGNQSINYSAITETHDGTLWFGSF